VVGRWWKVGSPSDVVQEREIHMVVVTVVRDACIKEKERKIEEREQIRGNRYCT
jgi:hypothetical protein